MKDRRPPIGSWVSLVYVRESLADEKSRIINQIGNYVILENGLKFHALDDSVGDEIWAINNESVVVSIIH